MKNKIKAVMIGHAVGDALGVPVEFVPRKGLPKRRSADSGNGLSSGVPCYRGGNGRRGENNSLQRILKIKKTKNCNNSSSFFRDNR